jgi:Winged helix DNA-binding domain
VSVTAKPVDICGQRLANQHLIRQTVDKPSEIVRLLGAVQAQDYAGAKWGVAQRTRNATDAVIEKELDEGAILRTHVLRPTWHFVAAADIRWMLALTGPRVNRVLASYDPKLGIDEAVIRKSQKILTKALQGGKHLTRAELAQVMKRAGIPTEGTQRLARIVMHAELDGLICSGPRRGKQFTYGLLEERAPPAKELKGDEALSELAKRYLNTRGPATVDDFAWWSGLTKTAAKRGIEAVGSDIEHVIIAGRGHWFPTPVRIKRKSPFAHLLPNYDEYFIGHKDRSAIQSVLRASGWDGNVSFLGGNILTINGQIVGGWSRVLQGETGTVELKLLTKLRDEERRAVAAEVKRFGAFLGVPVKLAE